MVVTYNNELSVMNDWFLSFFLFFFSFFFNTYIICTPRLFSVSPKDSGRNFLKTYFKINVESVFLFSCNSFIIKLIQYFSIAPFSLTSGHLQNTASGSRETKSTAVEQLRLETFNR